jgi:hypothetical protein
MLILLREEEVSNFSFNDLKKNFGFIYVTAKNF